MHSTINIHIHTTHSDGGNTPAEIIAMLKDAGVTTFSITDHDTVEGNVEAAALAQACGLTHINGIELSCCFADGEIGLDESWVIHVLGYGFNLGLMRGKLAELENKKHSMLLELFELLVADGYNIDTDSIAQDGKIEERTHIAKALVQNGYATDNNEAFAKILNTDRYRPFAKYKPSIKEGVKIIHDCDGLAVWAHPFNVTRGGKRALTKEQVAMLRCEMLESDIDGVEVYYQRHTPEQIEGLSNYADHHHFYKTVGTDYHNTGEQLAFNVVEPDLKVEVMVRRIMGIEKIMYCDECPKYGIQETLDANYETVAAWGRCRKKSNNPREWIIIYKIVNEPMNLVYSNVAIPDWCPLKNKGDDNLHG